MEFSLQISDIPWLMSSINRIGKDCHGRGSKKEEEMKKRRKWRRGCYFPPIDLYIVIIFVISLEQVRCSSVNHWIFLQSIGATYREITLNQFWALNPNIRFIRRSHRPWNTVPCHPPWGTHISASRAHIKNRLDESANIAQRGIHAKFQPNSMIRLARAMGVVQFLP